MKNEIFPIESKLDTRVNIICTCCNGSCGLN